MAKNDGFYNTASPDRYVLLKEFAHKNKLFATEAESLLWEHIRANRLAVKFNRQHIIGDYIVDFVCIEKKLVVEVDGGYHSEYQQIKKDEYRTERLNGMGFSVIRFSNEEILGNIFGVINQMSLQETMLSINVGAGVSFAKHFEADLRYNIPISKTSDFTWNELGEAVWDQTWHHVKSRTNAWSISVTYFF